MRLISAFAHAPLMVKIVAGLTAAAGLGMPVLFEPNRRYFREVSRASERAQKEGRGLFSGDVPCTPAAAFASQDALIQELPTSAATAADAATALEAIEVELADADDLLDRLADEALEENGWAVLEAAGYTRALTDLRDRADENRSDLERRADTMRTTRDELGKKEREARAVGEAEEAEEERLRAVRAGVQLRRTDRLHREAVRHAR